MVDITAYRGQLGGLCVSREEGEALWVVYGAHSGTSLALAEGGPNPGTRGQRPLPPPSPPCSRAKAGGTGEVDPLSLPTLKARSGVPWWIPLPGCLRCLGLLSLIAYLPPRDLQANVIPC
jgi:hypothetical protein